MLGSFQRSQNQGNGRVAPGYTGASKRCEVTFNRSQPFHNLSSGCPEALEAAVLGWPQFPVNLIQPEFGLLYHPFGLRHSTPGGASRWIKLTSLREPVLLIFPAWAPCRHAFTLCIHRNLQMPSLFSWRAQRAGIHPPGQEIFLSPFPSLWNRDPREWILSHN